MIRSTPPPAWRLTAARLGPAAGWFVLAFVSQAVILKLTDAGNLLRYQHFPPLSALAARHPWLLAFLAGQAAAVTARLVRLQRQIAEGGLRISRARLLVAVLLSVSTAATVSPEPLRYAAELGFAAALQILSMATILIAALALPEVSHAQKMDRLFGPDGDEIQPTGALGDRFAWTSAAVATILAAGLCLSSYQRHPHVPDEVVYLLHARYFAAGMLTMPAPPVPAAFDLDLMTYEPDRWFSPVPPGWPAALAIGARLGVPWLVNPVLAGLCVILGYVLLTHLYPRRIARYATALLAISPWFLFLGMSFMTHMFTLACALLGAVGVARARITQRWTWGLAAGIGVGLSSLIRPLDGLMIGLLIGAWAIGVGGRRLAFPALTALLAGTVLAGSLAFPYNRFLTGDPLKFPINAYTDAHYGPNSNAYGFGADRGLGWALDPHPGHGPVDGLINTNLNVFGINTDLFGWSTGSLVLVAVLFCFGRLGRSDWLMIASTLVIVTGYFFYYYSGGPDFAARYWFPVIIPLVALSARGLRLIEQRAGRRTVLAVGALVVMSLTLYVPWRAIDKYWHFRGMRADVRALAASHGIHGDLVLIRGNRFPDYESAAAENPIDLRSATDTIYAWDRDPDVRAATLRAYPGRRVWLIDGPSLTGTGYRVVAGPIAGAALEALGGSR